MLQALLNTGNGAAAYATYAGSHIRANCICHLSQPVQDKMTILYTQTCRSSSALSGLSTVPFCSDALSYTMHRPAGSWRMILNSIKTRPWSLAPHVWLEADDGCYSRPRHPLHFGPVREALPD